MPECNYGHVWRGDEHDCPDCAAEEAVVARADGAVVVQVDGHLTFLKRSGTYPSLEEMQAAVGGYIERVRVPWTERTILVVNEEGVIHGLPLNPLASAIAGQAIVGPAILMPDRMLR